MVYSLQQILHAFRNWLISESNLAWNETRRNWTPRIKAFFGQLGRRGGFIPIYTRASPKQSEYLLDLVWKVESPRRFLELGMESELSGRPSEIMKDFEKLLDVKANIKVGVFQLNSDTEEKTIEKMQEKLMEQAYHMQTEKYLVIFLRYHPTRNRGEVEISGHKLSITGEKEEIERDNYSFPYSSDS